MKRKLLFISSLIIAASTVVSAQNPRRFYKVGEDFYENQKYQDAIGQFTKALNLDPEYEKAYEMRALVYETIEEYGKAAEDYDRLSVFDEKEETYYYNSARMYYILGNYPKALMKLDRSLENKRIFPEARQLKVNTLIHLEKYHAALETSKNALRNKENDINFYNYGRANELVGLNGEAEGAYEKAIRKNKTFLEAYVNLADLQRRQNKLNEAMETITEALQIDKNFPRSYKVRSAIFADQLKYAEAINDISTVLLLEPDNEMMYFLRGRYYQDYAQHMNAISDFNKVLTLNPDNIEALYNRAYSYEQILKFDEAVKDYNKLAEIAENDKKAKELLVLAEKRMYELNRESDRPEVTLVNPKQQEDDLLFVPRKMNVIPVVGQVKDESEIKEVMVNDLSIPFTKKDGNWEFLTSVNLQDSENIVVDVKDIYDNHQRMVYKIERTEIEPPDVRILAPYASDNNIIYLDSDEPKIFVEGSIADESLIKSIYINDIRASYVPDEINPTFQAMVNIQNRDRFTVKAEDQYGNLSEVTFTLNREGATIASNNPMGKTWVVFIENSNYQSFASLEGPIKDISLMKTALARYSIHNFIHKKDLTKQEMERFFAIELRDLLRSNRVNSLLVWYAGHGKFVNETGYWVPVDARRDDEFTYFNINALKASMQSYPSTMAHTLIVTDACESGPSFYQAMRAELQERSCNDWAAVRLKSSQVFSSAGYELAVDNSQFTRTFANVLANNPDGCIPIESIVLKVTDAVAGNNQQEPQFGKISGLEDENGTFFFISK